MHFLSYIKEGKMKKRDLSHGFILLVILVIAVSGLFFFSKLTFTGYVTNVGTNESTFIPSNFDVEGVNFTNTKVDNGKVILSNVSLSGVYTSEIFGNGSNVTWNNLLYASNVYDGGTAVFYYRICDDALCDAETFNEFAGGALNLAGKYIQYKIEMSGDPSPRLKEVNITYTPIVIPAPTCSDGVQNQNETGIDCGGVCNACACTESWSCGVWSTCSGGTQTRTCTDSNSCGTTTDKPSESNSCVEETTNEETTTEPESNVQVSVGEAAAATTCTPNWQCDEWSACESSQRTRACVDSNGCGSEAGIPATSESCESASTSTETCSDGVKNQNEEGVDCGGVCEKKCTKNFFSIVGSAVTGSVETGKKFFQTEILGNKTRTFIILGAIVLVVAGFIIFKKFAFKISLKKKGRF